jgi:hypothetical protein
LAEPPADIFGAALLCGPPNFGQVAGKVMGIGFDRFAIHRVAPLPKVMKIVAQQNFDE